MLHEVQERLDIPSLHVASGSSSSSSSSSSSGVALLLPLLFYRGVPCCTSGVPCCTSTSASTRQQRAVHVQPALQQQEQLVAEALLVAHRPLALAVAETG